MRHAPQIAALGSLVWLVAASAHAQISTDGSLGPQLDLAPVGNEFQILDDYGAYQGENLFHSFSSFDVPSGQIATFYADNFTPARVIARVTGGNGTQIDGTLRSAIAGADLFLLDSRGVSFGDGARLEVDGSFYASSADALRFTLGPDFVTADATPGPLLSAAAPAAFGFTSLSPAQLMLARTDALSVPEGETLSFVGGDVFVLGDIGLSSSIVIDAPGAQVEIASAAGPIDIDVELSDFDMASAPPGALGTVEFVAATALLSGTSAVPAGSLMIRAGEIVLSGGSRIIAENASSADAAGPIDLAASGELRLIGNPGGFTQTLIQSWTQGEGAAGDVLLTGDTVEIRAGAQVAVFNGGLPTHTGEAPDAIVRGRVVEIEGGGRIDMIALSADPAGRIDIVASERISLDGGATLAADLLFEHSGAPGELLLDAPLVEVEGGAQILSWNAGSSSGTPISIQADHLRVSNAATPSAETLIAASDGGGIDLDVEFLEVLDGGQIGTRSFADRPAGTLGITADHVLVSGQDADGTPAQLFSRARESATPTGTGGLLDIDTRILDVLDGGEISASTFGAADAGRIDIDATERVTVQGGLHGASLISASVLGAAASGNGGLLEIDSGLLELRDGGQVTTSTIGVGDAGRIVAHADRIEVSGVDPLVANASGFFSRSNTALVPDGGDGGGIELTARSGVRIANGGTVLASAAGTGLAGDILIDGGTQVEIDNANVSTQSLASAGGNVKLTASGLVYLKDAQVVTDVQGGAGGGGDVTIDPTHTVLNRSSITARADLGAGGNISIFTDYYFQSADSFLDASSNLGIDGVIAITSPDTDVTGGLAALPSTYLDASKQLERDCAVRTERAGSFTVKTRGAVIAPPDALGSPAPAASCEEEEAP